MARRKGTARADLIVGTDDNDFIEGLGGHDRLLGNAGNDTLLGGAGNDTLDGGSGIDHLRAGSGNDTLVFTLAENSGPRSAQDRYDGGSGNDTLRLNLTSAEWSNAAIKSQIMAFSNAIGLAAGGPVNFSFAALGLKVTSIEKLELYIDGQLLDLGVQVVDLSGSTADETIVVTGSSSQVTTGSGNDTITGGSGDDTISSGGGNDLVTLGAGDDVVLTGSGNDTIIAGNGVGDDYIDGGAGNDTVRYDSAINGVNIDLRLQDRSAVSFTPTNTPGVTTVGQMLVSQGLAATTGVALATGAAGDVDTDILIGIENIVAGQGNDTITGNDQDNRLDGAGGNDQLDGQVGLDALKGGQGNDTLAGGLDDDTLEGGAGDDAIDGGGGYDTLVLTGNLADYTIQTLGNGYYSFTNTTGNGDGVDIFREIEDITFADTTVGLWTLVGFIDVFGDNNPNVLTGTDAREWFFGLDGNDSIDGGLEEDFFVGGRGNDTMHGGGPQDDLNFVWDGLKYDTEYDDAVQAGFAASGVTVNLATGVATDVYGDTDTVIEIERIWGTRANDHFIGSGADEAFDPNGGNDTIDGGAGFDSLHYHLVDEYYGAGSTTGITVTFSTTVAGSGTAIDPLGDTDTFAGIEAVRGTRYADQFTGGIGFQQFRGFDGADTYDGGADWDSVTYHDDANYGGLGGITFDLAVKDGQGYATVIDGFGATDLLRNIEGIRGTGTADLMLGDDTDNYFEAEAGADMLGGRGGADELYGGLGDDTIDGGTDGDFLDAGAGADVVVGGIGNDAMIGGADADQFLFDPNSGHDRIEDFEVGIDHLILFGGLTIASLTESDVNGDGAIDTTVLFSSGDQVDLWFVSGVIDPNSLL